jgi:transposase-like protein
MTIAHSALSELLEALKAGEVTDTVRSSLAWILQELIEAELTAAIGALPNERTEARRALRNGNRGQDPEVALRGVPPFDP